jgi:putative hemolysin
MKNQQVFYGLVVGVSLSLLGCHPSKKIESLERKQPDIALQSPEEVSVLPAEGERGIGAPNPSAVYCSLLGYKYKIVRDNVGNEYGTCILPDGTLCVRMLETVPCHQLE